MHHGQKLKEILSKKGLRKEDFANKLGVSRQMLYTYYGYESFDDELIKGLARAGIENAAEVFKIEQEPINDDYVYPIILTEGKTAVLKFPRSKMSTTDVEILRKVIEQIELSVGVNQNASHKAAEDLKKKENQN